MNISRENLTSISQVLKSVRDSEISMVIDNHNREPEMMRRSAAKALECQRLLEAVNPVAERPVELDMATRKATYTRRHDNGN